MSDQSDGQHERDRKFPARADKQIPTTQGAIDRADEQLKKSQEELLDKIKADRAAKRRKP